MMIRVGTHSYPSADPEKVGMSATEGAHTYRANWRPIVESRGGLFRARGLSNLTAKRHAFVYSVCSPTASIPVGALARGRGGGLRDPAPRPTAHRQPSPSDSCCSHHDAKLQPQPNHHHHQPPILPHLALSLSPPAHPPAPLPHTAAPCSTHLLVPTPPPGLPPQTPTRWSAAL